MVRYLWSNRSDDHFDDGHTNIKKRALQDNSITQWNAGVACVAVLIVGTKLIYHWFFIFTYNFFKILNLFYLTDSPYRSLSFWIRSPSRWKRHTLERKFTRIKTRKQCIYVIIMNENKLFESIVDWAGAGHHFHQQYYNEAMIRGDRKQLK